MPKPYTDRGYKYGNEIVLFSMWLVPVLVGESSTVMVMEFLARQRSRRAFELNRRRESSP